MAFTPDPCLTKRRQFATKIFISQEKVKDFSTSTVLQYRYINLLGLCTTDRDSKTNHLEHYAMHATTVLSFQDVSDIKDRFQSPTEVRCPDVVVKYD